MDLHSPTSKFRQATEDVLFALNAITDDLKLKGENPAGVDAELERMSMTYCLSVPEAGCGRVILEAILQRAGQLELNP